MKWSQAFCPTLKETPHDAELASHRLMLRAGLMRQISSGIYTYLPVGLKIMRRVEGIVREEMNRAGGLEVLMPMVLPADLWRETGRWDGVGKELLRFKDRKNQDYCLGPTHEEVITDLARRELRSYRDLPKLFYQIQTKFRDEVRPRFGLMRGREFSMKDAYSFHVDSDSADETYDQMYKAYTRIFERCELDFRAVEADSGNIGGSRSQEFMVLAQSGEDAIAYCQACHYAANLEKAMSAPTLRTADISTEVRLKEIHTGDAKTIAEVSAALKVNAAQVLKTLAYISVSNLGKEEALLVVLPGDRDVNEVALTRLLGAQHIRLASDAEVTNICGVSSGNCGPLNARVPIWVDTHVDVNASYVVGGNQEGLHVQGFVVKAHAPTSRQAALSLVQAEDSCPVCQKPLRIERGIEVGHIFKLGTKYSDSMNATFVDAQGKSQPFVMGCYGIGVSRTVAAAVEQRHDDAGIIFPKSIAPYDIAVVPTDMQNSTIVSAAQAVYEAAQVHGADVLIDDRNLGAGIKFKDADLLGIPLRITVGKTFMISQELEFKRRQDNQAEKIPMDQLNEALTHALHR